MCVFLTKKVAYSACTVRSVETVTTALAVGRTDSRHIVGPEKGFEIHEIYKYRKSKCFIGERL